MGAPAARLRARGFGLRNWAASGRSPEPGRAQTDGEMVGPGTDVRTVSVDEVTSEDGTTIAYTEQGAGPPLVLVAGALCDRTSMRVLAERLSVEFSVFSYDRRGRGSSGDSPLFSVHHEIEDLAAVIAQAGGPVGVYGHSSGAVLALEAAADGLPIDRLAVYEPPFIVEGTRPIPGGDLALRLERLVAAGRRSAALDLFMTEGAGMPPAVVARMASSPGRAGLESLAHTLPYDVAVVGAGNRLPAERMASIGIPTVVMVGGASPAWAHAGAGALVAAIGGSGLVTLEGQTHAVDQAVLAPVLADFFA